MITALGTKITHLCDRTDLTAQFAWSFFPEGWKRQACREDGTHEVVFMHSGDWYCYHCGTYDEPGA